jgi:hypothetical protein
VLVVWTGRAGLSKMRAAHRKPETRDQKIKEMGMSEQTDQLAEVEKRLSIAQENLRQLTEQAAAYSGAEDEERAAQRIQDQEDEIARLTKLRAELTAAISGARRQ